MEPVADASNTGKKRKRTAQACGPCRTKKTKCDGVHPECTPCVSLGYKCSYTLDSNAPPSGQVLVSQNYIHKLEQRIQSLEQERPAPPRPPPPHAHVQGPGPPQGQPQQRTPTTTGNTPAGHMSQPVTPFDPAPVFVDQSPAGTNQDHPIDGMGMLLAPQAPHLADQATPREQEVYGPMSGISFHHMLLDRLLPGYWCLTSPSTSVDGLLGPTSDSFVLTKEDLPSRAEADRMFYYFETHTWQVYPFVELAVARRAYDELIESRDLAYMSHQPMTCVLFSAFAVVESIATGSFTNVPIGRLALRLVRKHLDWPHSTVKVQALLLGAMVMQGMDHPGYSWDLIGYAIRSAYAVGLHDDSVNRRFSPVEREMRGRVWWACYTFDRVVTVSIGRPSAITVEPNIPFPQPLPGEPEAPIYFFCDSIRLHETLSDVVSKPPRSFQNSSSDFIQAIVGQTYDLEKRYASWCDTAKLGRSNTSLATVLTLRGLMMRLLLHRRVMLVAIHQYIPGGSHKQPPQTSLEHLEARQQDLAFGISLGLIIETAVHTIQILEVSDDVVLSAPWYQLFYAMNAFMCLVATLLLDLSEWEWFIRVPGVPIVQALHSVQRVVRGIGERYQRASARQALSIIEHVLQTLNVAEQPAQDVPVPNLQDLPHLDLDELYRTLGLDLFPMQ